MSEHEDTLPLDLAETLAATDNVATRPVGPNASLDDASRQVGGRYRLERELGRGGMGSVFLARDCELDELVALKLLHPRLGSDPRAALLFRSEVKLARRITHPNVARTFDLHTNGDAPFLTMEYVEGRDLSRVLDGHRLPLEEAFGYLDPILDGLIAAHEAGVVHRDLKPTNILVATTGRVVVTDFGIATTAANESEVTGTPAYLAPEQATGSAVDARTDLYALGIMLREMLTGELPWEGPTVAAIVMRRFTEEPPPLPAHVPAEIANLILRMMAREPDDRPASASEVKRRLEAFRAGEASPPVRSRTYNLRMPRNTFIGRASVLDDLSVALESNGCVLLVGPGGVGKTRLAEEYARAQLDTFEGGIVKANLVDVVTRADVLRTVSMALDLPVGADPAQQVANALEGTRTLVILDGAEQCFDEVSALLELWSSPEHPSKILVTLRRRIPFSVGATVELGPMSPESAIALLQRRASELSATDVATHDASAIVAAVDRLPLAIEMAAARLRIMPARKLLDRLEDQLRVLRTRGSAARHATMEAVLDHTWEQLSPAAQRALAFASVVRDSANLDAFSELIDIDDDAWPEEVLESLWENCLLDWDRDADRIRLPHLVRAYAASKLDELGAAETDAAAARHAALYADFARELMQRGLVADDYSTLRDVEPDYGNLVAAFHHSCSSGHIDDATECLRVIRHIARLRAAYNAVRQMTDSLVEAARRAEKPEPALTWATTIRADVALEQQRYSEASELAASWSEAEVGRARAELLLIAGAVSYRSNKPLEAKRSFELARELSRDLEFPWGEIKALGNLALIDDALGEPHAARLLLEQTRDLAEAHGFTRMMGVIEINLSTLAGEQLEYEEAVERARRARTLLAGDRSLMAAAPGNLGAYLAQQHRFAEALPYLEEALLTSRRNGTAATTGSALCNLGSALNDAGRHDEAKPLLSEALELLVPFEDWRFLGFSHCALGECHAVSGDIDAMRDSFAEGIGAFERGGLGMLAADAMRRYALVETADPARALASLRRAEQLLESIEVPQGIRDEVQAALKELLTPEIV